MKLNNKGFALTSIIYMLIVLFLMILLLILANLATRKVVLDKIKNDVKENLNQGGLLAQNTYTVTFDPTIGQINQKTKQVKYNEPYGELPTPTREGYKFIGWTSKNLAPEINESNYTVSNYINKTTSEFRNENGTNYIRINGNTSTSNTDTLWRIYNNNKIELNQGDYVLSFDVRSQNANEQKITKKTGANDGKTGIYINNAADINNMISNIENDYNFDNDGQWHHFTSLVTIPYDISNALIVIGNDQPNLYGPNSYIDIKNIQLEPGNTATEYEPYFGNITSDTIVTRGENHTLYAMWEPLYMVTFDPNGGTLSETTKWVEYNEPYGELPTPTKEGYTFLGWNGKNMFDMTGWLNSFSTATHGTIVKGENSIQITATSDDAYTNSWQGNSVLKTSIMPNTKYTISWESDNNITALSYGFINGNWSDGYRVAGNNAIKKNFVFTAPQDGEYITYRVGASTSGDSITYSNIQIEEGETATEYEPYYITPSTTVVQKNNHTLKAIWEANS